MRLFISTLFFFIVLSVIAFFSVPAIKEVRRSNAIEREIENLKYEADKITADNDFLRERVDYLKSNHHKERLAKDKLNLRNPGEQVVVVQPIDENSNKDEESIKSINDNRVGEDIYNFKKWWRYFFK